MSSSRQVQFDSSLLDNISSELQTGSGIFGPSSAVGSTAPSKSPAQVYFNTHRIMDVLEDAVHELASSLPDDPMLCLSHFFLRLSPSTPTVQSPTNPARLTIQTHPVLVIDSRLDSSDIMPEKSAPVDDVDHQFVSYLSELAASVRRGTT